MRPGQLPTAHLPFPLAHVLISENLVDSRFVENHVEGFSSSANTLKASPEASPRITGIPAEDIVPLVRLRVLKTLLLWVTACKDTAAAETL